MQPQEEPPRNHSHVWCPLPAVRILLPESTRGRVQTQETHRWDPSKMNRIDYLGGQRSTNCSTKLLGGPSSSSTHGDLVPLLGYNPTSAPSPGAKEAPDGKGILWIQPSDRWMFSKKGRHIFPRFSMITPAARSNRAWLGARSGHSRHDASAGPQAGRSETHCDSLRMPRGILWSVRKKRGDPMCIKDVVDGRTG